MFNGTNPNPKAFPAGCFNGAGDSPEAKQDYRWWFSNR